MEADPKGSRDRNGGGRRVAVGLADDEPPKHHMLPVWFFIGLTLLMYGVIICATGIFELSHPSATVLARLHAPIWWGAIMAAAGAFYVSQYRPGKR